MRGGILVSSNLDSTSPKVFFVAESSVSASKRVGGLRGSPQQRVVKDRCQDETQGNEDSLRQEASDNFGRM